MRFFQLPPRVAALVVMMLPLILQRAPALEAVVEIEEDLYDYTPADNGAGPLWCSGSTCVVRVGAVVYATGLQTLPDAKPLNNCRWVLWRRDETGWKRLFVDHGRTREPAPLGRLADGGVVVSANPTLQPPGREGGGPARPEIVRFADGAAPAPAPDPERWTPAWDGEPAFSEHSYRSLACDGPAAELVLFQNIGYTHAEWAFRDRSGRWSARGQLKWPWGADYAKPQPIRVCYPNVALRQRETHFFGVSDIVEPNPAWRAFKKEITGREWDYDFRRLFHTWTPDLTREPFREWTEVASREATCGWLSPCDLWLAPDRSVRVLWTERALDERLRAKFFPDARQSQSLNLGTWRQGAWSRRTLVESTEDRPGPVVSAARFHELPDGRLLVICHRAGGGPAGNQVFELAADGSPGRAAEIRFAKPFTSFFTATPRGGSAPSEWIDLLGVRAGNPHTISYARVRLE